MCGNCVDSMQRRHRSPMPRTSVKHREFIRESMVGKNVTELPGIGDTYGERLVAIGFDQADLLLAKYLLVKKDEELFKDWLRNNAGVASNHAKSCYNGLSGWCEQHL